MDRKSGACEAACVRVALLILAVVGMFGAPLAGAPPPNDDLASAWPLATGVPTRIAEGTGSLEEGEQQYAFPETQWFRWTAPRTGWHRALLDGSPLFVTVWASPTAPADFHNLRLMSYRDPWEFSGFFHAEAGQDYFIRLEFIPNPSAELVVGPTWEPELPLLVAVTLQPSAGLDAGQGEVEVVGEMQFLDDGNPLLETVYLLNPEGTPVDEDTPVPVTVGTSPGVRAWTFRLRVPQGSKAGHYGLVARLGNVQDPSFRVYYRSWRPLEPGFDILRVGAYQLGFPLDCLDGVDVVNTSSPTPAPALQAVSTVVGIPDPDDGLAPFEVLADFRAGPPVEEVELLISYPGEWDSDYARADLTEPGGGGLWRAEVLLRCTEYERPFHAAVVARGPDGSLRAWGWRSSPQPWNEGRVPADPLLVHWSPVQPFPGGQSADFVLPAVTGLDTEGPIIELLAPPQDTVIDLAGSLAARTVNYSVRVTDARSGVAYVGESFHSGPSAGAGELERVSGDENSGVYEGTVVIDPWEREEGPFVDLLTAVDNRGKSTPFEVRLELVASGVRLTSLDRDPGGGRPGHVSVTPNGPYYPQGSQVTFTAHPAPGFVLHEWGNHGGDDNPLEVQARCELLLIPTWRCPLDLLAGEMASEAGLLSLAGSPSGSWAVHDRAPAGFRTLVATGVGQPGEVVLEASLDGPCRLQHVVGVSGSNDLHFEVRVEGGWQALRPSLSGSTGAAQVILDIPPGRRQIRWRAPNPWATDDKIATLHSFEVSRPDSLDDWIAFHGLDEGMSHPLATPANDGIPNILKHAFRMDLTRRYAGNSRYFTPGSSVGGLPVWSVDTSGLVPVLQLHYLRRTEGLLVRYRPQFSSFAGSRGGWEDAVRAEMVEPLGDGWESVTVKDAPPLGAGSRFGRVKIEE